MAKRSTVIRLALSLSLLGPSCSSLLGIEEGTPRGGSAGTAGTAGTSSGGSPSAGRGGTGGANAAGGASGKGGSTSAVGGSEGGGAPLGGEAGMAGHGAISGGLAGAGGQDGGAAGQAGAAGASGDGGSGGAACGTAGAPNCPCTPNEARACGDCGDGLQRCVDGPNGIYSACVGGTAKVTYYLDRDHDLHGDPKTPLSTCSAPPAGYVSVSDDCCDTDSDVHPGQTAFFSRAAECGGWDYDCNQVTEVSQPALGGCVVVSSPGCYTPAYGGWAGSSVPGCGMRGDFILADDSGCFTLTMCNSYIATETPNGYLQKNVAQACR